MQIKESNSETNRKYYFDFSMIVIDVGAITFLLMFGPNKLGTVI